MTTAFEPVSLAGTKLSNRIAMAPMTRSRAYGPGAAPTADTATYYAQRASAGLIITEGIQPSVIGQGYPSTPGLHSAEQVAAWRQVTGAVHAQGGVIFAQLMHTGRIGHPSLLPEGLVPVGASPVAAAGKVFTAQGPQDFVTPRELTDAEILTTIGDFAAAARNAVAAGFDGVEVHGANGYLLHQFLSTNANQRSDRWGGTVTGRIRLTVEVVRAVADVIGAHRTGLRISPANPFNDITEDEHRHTYTALADTLDPLGPAYLHIAEADDRDLTRELRRRWDGPLILNPFTPGTVTGPEQLALIEEGTADLISFGGLFLANPDLPARLAAAGPYNTPDPATFYGGDARGYIDYPTLDGSPSAVS
ncbi:alkene reductase [Micromonospora tulbaghiae]|uniref:Alkene reductase n=1 Tax=Micromonospora tulbaghiae TaxID=479978 RepID=A0AAW4JK37_9ACTN|nr:alkene reductase [Micromonospora tulbaghiae]MBO4139214.1 alkene reductase [Micromonospora tulbaghiae]MDX5456368.1 alkene reductase [Micromonospora tulbaghiae]SCE69033.1 N-ethylmaleimide reductase [Micromonospora tulbaghiae]